MFRVQRYLLHNCLPVRRKFLQTSFRIILAEDPSHFHRCTSSLQPDKSQSSFTNKLDTASASSIEEIDKIFESYKSVRRESISAEHSIEVLVQLIDLHTKLHSGRKVMLNLAKSSVATRQDREYFLSKVHVSPVLREILCIISKNLTSLSDEDLSSCLIFVKALKFSIREEFAQDVLQEMLRRKGTLSTPALRNLILALRNEHLYGCLVVAEFLPLFYSKIQKLSPESSHEEIRYISSCMRTLYFMRCTSTEIVNTYLIKISEILDHHPDLHLEALVRIIPVLFDLQFVAFTFESKEEKRQKTLIVPELIRKCCILLEPKIHQLDESHMQALSKFLEFQQEPVSVILALWSRANDLWRENYTRVDLMSMVRPKSHDIATNSVLLKYFNEFLDLCEDFKPTVHIAYRALKKLHFDVRTYDKYWSKVNELLLEQTYSSTDTSEVMDSYSEDHFCDIENSSVFVEANVTNRLLALAHDYVNTLFRLDISYSHKAYEKTTLDLILKLFKDYKEGKAVLLPSEYAKAVAFLLAIKYTELKIDPVLLHALNVKDLILIHKGAEIGRHDSFILADLLKVQSERLFRKDLTAMECIRLTTVNASFQRRVSLNPMFKTCLENVSYSTLWIDSSAGEKMLHLMLRTGFNYPQGFDRVARIILERKGEVSLKCVQKFLWASYVCGTEASEAVHAAAKITEKYFDHIHPFRILDSALALCYHGALSVDLIKRIFDVGFIELLDEQIRSMLMRHSGFRDPFKVRDVFMSLNRAVCIDVPEANVPWFHQKYCEEMASVSGYVENDVLNTELSPILESIVGRGKFSRNALAPYCQQIDFLLHLDEDGHPRNMAATYCLRPVTKLAIITHRPKHYTLNVRQLKGRHLLKKRHLESLGYKVIDISPFQWNSLGMIDTPVKKKFLRSCIFG